MKLVVDNSKLDLSNPNHFKVTGNKFQYYHNGLEVSCQGIFEKCVGLYFDYSFLNSSTSSEGTVDQMQARVDLTKLELSSPANYKIANDIFSYSLDGTQLNCRGAEKCVAWIQTEITKQQREPAFSYSDSINSA